MTIPEVASRLEMSYQVARRWGQYAGYIFRRAPPTSRMTATAARWGKVDWTKSNREIANRLGVTYERVRQVRKGVF
jgi:transposase